MVDMNDSELWALGSRCYEKLRGVDNMSYFGLWAQGSRCYEQPKVVDAMNDYSMSSGL